MMKNQIGLSFAEVIALRRLGLREDEVQYLAWLKRKERIRNKKNFEFRRM